MTSLVLNNWAQIFKLHDDEKHSATLINPCPAE